MMAHIVQRKHVYGGQPQRRGLRAKVGGKEYTVGGWSAFEVNRRQARWESAKTGGAPPEDERPGTRYPDNDYVYADDVVHSITHGGAQTRPLIKAANRLSDTLRRLEDRLCDPSADGVWECLPATVMREHEPPETSAILTIPPITSVDLREFATDSKQQSSPEAMFELGEDVLSTAAAVGVPLSGFPPIDESGSLPALPTRAVRVDDDEAVLRLEAATGPYLTSIEDMQGALATRLDAAATAISARLDETAVPA